MGLIFIHLSICKGIQMFLNMFVCIWQCFCLVFWLMLIIWCCDHILTASSPPVHPVSHCFHGNRIPLWTTDISFSSCAVCLITVQTFRQLIISVHITSVCITRVWWIIWKRLSCHGSFALFILIERLFCSARIALVRLILVSVSHPTLKPNHIVRRSWKTQWNIPVKVEEM